MTKTLQKPKRSTGSVDKQQFVEFGNLLAAIGKAQAVIEFDMDGTIIKANDNFLNTLGYSLDEIKGRHHSMFCEEGVKNSAEYREFWARLNRGENLSGEYRRVGKGGKLVIINASYNPIGDASGKLVKVVKFATDVTQTAVANADQSAKLAAIGKAQAVIEFQMDGTIVDANENFLSTLGYTLDEIKGRHHSMFCEESQKNSAEYREFWARLNRGESLPGEYRRVGKGGKLVIIQASYNPIRDNSGKFVKVVKYATDITESALVNADLAAKLVAIGKAQAVIEFKMDGTIVDANENFLKTMGYSMDEIKGRHHSTFASESLKNSPEYREFWARLNRGENLPGEYQRFGKGGKEVWIQASYNPIPDHNGKLVKVVKYASDVTTAVKARQEMARILELVNSSSSTLGSSAEELTAVSTQMAANAEETSAQANVVSAASEQVSKNVQTVSTGVEEMNSAIREIAKNASESARVAEQAVSTAESANVSISKLGESSIEIGNVIKVITSIAEQTNLLALNATIEAARAGEAGKGFAVVANEVKELAKETARATEDIGRKVETIQSDTKGAVDSIQQISQVIAQINDISNTIASAVEEQTATATEMSRNVAEAAKGTAEIAQNITAVAQAAQNTTQGASNAQQAASELARMASDLQKLGAGQGGSPTLAV